MKDKDKIDGCKVVEDENKVPGLLTHSVPLVDWTVAGAKDGLVN